MNYKVISRAATTVITVDELKEQLGLFGDDSYDLELLNTIEAAQDLVEDQAGVLLRDTTIEQPLASFNEHQFPHYLKKVDWLKVKYINEQGGEITMSDSDYILDQSGVLSRIVFKNAPAVSNDYSYPIWIEYTAGPLDIPARVKHAVLVAGTELFEVRGETTEKARAKAAMTIERLLGSYKRVTV